MVLLSGAVVVAGGAAMISRGGKESLAAPKAEIAGAALAPTESAQTPEEVAAFQALADQPAAVAERPVASMLASGLGSIRPDS